MKRPFEFAEIGRLPAPGDNGAIATRQLEAGSCFLLGEETFRFSSTIPLGHRFAVQNISRGSPLLSWGMPFGEATREIKPGEYMVNKGIIEALQIRNLGFALPEEANFRNRVAGYRFEEERFRAGRQVPLHGRELTFSGFRGSASRGVGTRNKIIVLGTSSRTASFVRELARRMRPLSDPFKNIDGVVAVAHTEGGGADRPNNEEYILRVLAGFMVHPNVGAVLAVDTGLEPVTNELLRDYMIRNRYPLNEVTHRFLTLKGGFLEGLREGEAIIKSWFGEVDRREREEFSASHLKIVMQCGGSDAFSGISGNPLASWVVKEIIRYGGSANLAETTELIGAERYILENVRDLTTARRFLATLEQFKERVSWHGVTAEGNPTGGNKMRGLYNITLKALGAAMKKHPEVRLDGVIDYGERIREPGFYFMNSPGNDLESIGGQVASGCNMIFFITGNGSITNFPFVPTIKIVSTTLRYQLLNREMDVNAGAYLDGTPMEELGKEMLDLTVRVASGELSKGEKAGHAQVSIWRNWKQTGKDSFRAALKRKPLTGAPLPLQGSISNPLPSVNPLLRDSRISIASVGLILPTSLCAGQVARVAAERMNGRLAGSDAGIARFAALVHTEGCGLSGETAFELFKRTMLGYLTHPSVRFGLLLEHGCEKTHNDFFRHAMRQEGIDPEQFGWASIQLDGGFEKVLRKVEDWFAERLGPENSVFPTPNRASNPFCVGLTTQDAVSEAGASCLSLVVKALLRSGAAVIIPEYDSLLSHPLFLKEVLGNVAPEANLAYGRAAKASGLYVQENPGRHWVESLTGIGGSGARIFLAYSSRRGQQGHPFIPMLQVADSFVRNGESSSDMDCFVRQGDAGDAEKILNLITDAVSRAYVPKAMTRGNTDFQFSRGLLGVST